MSTSKVIEVIYNGSEGVKTSLIIKCPSLFAPSGFFWLDQVMLDQPAEPHSFSVTGTSHDNAI